LVEAAAGFAAAFLFLGTGTDSDAEAPDVDDHPRNRHYDDSYMILSSSTGIHVEVGRRAEISDELNG
jgi:hypothetical protein